MKIQALPAFADNYFWLLYSATNGRECAVVDPGDAAPVLDALARHDLLLTHILITHHHHDHIDGVAELAARLPGVCIIAPADERIQFNQLVVGDGDRFTLFGATWQVIGVAGHTLSHIAYYAPATLFCGDTLFGAGCGRLFEGTPAQMFASLCRLAVLPPETGVYCAHEYTQANLRFAAEVDADNPLLRQRIQAVAALRQANQPSLPSTLALELATNPFLRCHEAALKNAAARRLGHQPPDAVATFAALRAWRNEF